MGHYYSRRVGKGVMFSGLELFSVGAIISMSNNYNSADEEYQIAIENRNGALTQNDYDHWNSESQTLLDSRNSAQIGRIAASTAAVGIWLWNTRDVKKKSRTSASLDKSRFSVGVNPRGQVEARINF